MKNLLIYCCMGYMECLRSLKGAEGHVGVGVNTSIKWIPEGGEDYQGLRISNSYLQRYLNHAGAKTLNIDGVSQWSSETAKLHNSQNKQASINKSSNFQATEQKRYNKFQDSKLMESSSTAHSEEHTKNVKGDSNMASSKKDLSFTNGPTKKSSVCVIL